jgi:hypothetical protein
MIEERRWNLWGVSQVNFHRMSLGRPDAGTIGIELKTFLLVGVDQKLERGEVQSGAMAVAGIDQFVGRGPARLVKHETDFFGFVPEYEAEELAGLRQCLWGRMHDDEERGCWK